MEPREFRKLEREPLFVGGSETAIEVDAIQRILPHRAPMLLLDRIVGVSLNDGTIRGEYRVRGDDPVLAGHFPGNPVYPGVLQTEAIGQLGLCLNWLLIHEATDVPDDASPIDASLIRIHHARFHAPVRPGEVMEVHAKELERNPLTAMSAGQIFVGDVLTTVAVFEVYFDE